MVRAGKVPIAMAAALGGGPWAADPRRRLSQATGLLLFLLMVSGEGVPKVGAHIIGPICLGWVTHRGSDLGRAFLVYTRWPGCKCPWANSQVICLN